MTTALLPYDLWLNPTSITRTRGYGHVAIPISEQPWDIIEQHILNNPDHPNLLSLVTDPNMERLEVTYDPEVIVPWVEPLGKTPLSCTCPDGGSWHGAHRKRGWAPSPVPAATRNRSFKVDPSCPWCSIPDGVFHQKRLAYDWPWRRTADTALTMIYVPPPARRIMYADSADEIAEVRINLSSFADQAVGVALSGDRDAVDSGVARSALREVVKQLQGARLQLIEFEINNCSTIPSHLTREVKGLIPVIAALECAGWFKEFLSSTSCIRVPYIPHYTHQRDWRIRGHFAIHEYFYSSWREFLEPLGVRFISEAI